MTAQVCEGLTQAVQQSMAGAAIMELNSQVDQLADKLNILQDKLSSVLVLEQPKDPSSGSEKEMKPQLISQIDNVSDRLIILRYSVKEMIDRLAL